MEKKTVTIPNISCHHCVMTIQREISALPGVKRIEGDPASKTVTIEWEAPATWDKIAAALAEINYPPA